MATTRQIAGAVTRLIPTDEGRNPDGTTIRHARRSAIAGGTDRPIDLHAEAGALLEQVATMSAGRAARSLTPGAEAPLTQTLMALLAGRDLQDHVAPVPPPCT